MKGFRSVNRGLQDVMTTEYERFMFLLLRKRLLLRKYFRLERTKRRAYSQDESLAYDAIPDHAVICSPSPILHSNIQTD